MTVLAEEGIYVGSDSAIHCGMRQEGGMNYRLKTHFPRESREVPVLEPTEIYQVLLWDIALWTGEHQLD